MIIALATKRYKKGTLPMVKVDNKKGFERKNAIWDSSRCNHKSMFGF